MNNKGFFRPDILFHQNDQANRTYIQNERENRLKRVEESLMLECQQAVQDMKVKHKIEDGEIVKLKKTYNSLRYENEKKQKLLDNLKISADSLSKKTKYVDEEVMRKTFVGDSLKEVQSTVNSR